MSALTTNYLTPSGREEAWRFTPLKRLAGLHDISVDVADRISISNRDSLPSGVKLTTPLSTDFPPAYESNDVVTNRIRKTVQKISLLSIDNDLELAEPIFLARKAGSSAELSRVVIQAGINSKATVVIENNGAGEIGEEIEISPVSYTHLTLPTKRIV